MDYDKTTIPESYDAARAIDPDAMRQWIDLVARHAPPGPQLIVDVGCGTGRFTHPLAKRFPALILGVDPSEKMLETARGKSANGRVQFMQASAEQLPLEDASAGLVFMSMMLHHVEDKPRAARECRRVLRSGGRLCIRNTTRDSTYPQQRFFPASGPSSTLSCRAAMKSSRCSKVPACVCAPTRSCRSRSRRTGRSWPRNSLCAQIHSTCACPMTTSTPVWQRCAPMQPPAIPRRRDDIHFFAFEA